MNLNELKKLKKQKPETTGISARVDSKLVAEALRILKKNEVKFTWWLEEKLRELVRKESK